MIPVRNGTKKVGVACFFLERTKKNLRVKTAKRRVRRVDVGPPGECIKDTEPRAAGSQGNSWGGLLLGPGAVKKERDHRGSRKRMVTQVNRGN